MGKVVGIILVACMGFSASLFEEIGEGARRILKAAGGETGASFDEEDSVLEAAPKFAARTWRSLAASVEAADLDSQIADFIAHVRRFKPDEITFEPLEDDTRELRATVTLKGVTCYFYTRP